MRVILLQEELLYSRKMFIGGNTYIGTTSSNFKVRMFLDRNNKIISAFPQYNRR